MKRILTIQDISCLGKCSLTVALPIISAMGVEASILPTAVLSTHTMFNNFTVKDLTDQISPITNHWKNENIGFDALYTGYLGSFEQIELVEKIFDDFKTEDNFIFVDPVMADNGKLYPAFDEAYAKRTALLCKKADFIVPNITEACFMTDTEYKESYDEAYIKELIMKLSEYCKGTVIITGVSVEEGKTGVMGYDVKANEYFLYQNDRVDASYHGTGDIFSSVCVGGMARGNSWKEAVKLAADYTAKTIKITDEDPSGPWYGVNFEATI